MKSNVEWKFWGRHDPLFGVAAWKGRQRGGDDPWTDEEFYALGERDWQSFVSHWEKYGRPHGRCVEIGCGAGRLTKYLADDFEQVDALDVSADMLRYAETQIVSEHVRFHLVSGHEIPLPSSSADAAFSAHVFQHFDTKADAARYFAEVARVLTPGGSMMIHLPIFAWPWGAGALVKFVYAFKKAAGSVKAAFKRWALRRGLVVSLMRMHSYELEWLYDELQSLGFESIEVMIFTPGIGARPHPFLLARKLIADS